ncbi:unnamed protein product [Caenorhabditis brenneri]
MSSGNIVKLDIGGNIFKTSRSTLTKFDGFFKTMLETEIPLEIDETGAIFIDRDPKHFRLILNYMRDGFVSIPDSRADIQEIQAEAQFYLLDDLVELCAAKLPEELPVKLPIIESDTHLLNLIASSEISGKPVVVIYYQIDDSDFKMPDIHLGSLMQDYKDKFDIWFKPSNNDTKGGSKYRVFLKNPLYVINGSLCRIHQTLDKYSKKKQQTSSLHNHY